MKKFITLFLTGLFLTFMSSCGDDDTAPADNPVEAYRISYTVEAGNGIRDFYNVSATYTDAEGTVITEAMDADRTISFDVPAKEAAKVYTLRMSVNAKDPVPAADPGKSYRVGHWCTMIVSEVHRNGDEKRLFHQEKAWHKDMDAKGVEAYVADHKSMVICEMSFAMPNQ